MGLIMNKRRLMIIITVMMVIMIVMKIIMAMMMPNLMSDCTKCESSVVGDARRWVT